MPAQLCPSCQSNLMIDYSVGVICLHCASCNRWYIDSFIENKHKKDQVHLIREPNGIEVVEGLQLDIQIKWVDIGKWNTQLVVGGGLLLMGCIALMAIPSEPDAALPGLLMTPIGAILFLRAFVLMINKTWITVTNLKLEVTHTPFNLWGWKGRYFNRKLVKRFFITRKEEGKVNNRPIFSYNLMMEFRDGKEMVLVDKIRSEAYAQYIEYRLEKYMNIDD